MKITVVVLFVLNMSTLASNTDLDNIVTLAEDTRDATVELKFPDHTVIPRSEEDAEYVFALHRQDQEVDSIARLSFGDQIGPCQDSLALSSEVSERVNARKFQIGVELVQSSAANQGAVTGGESRMYNYRTFMRASASEQGLPKAYQIQSISSLESRYRNANPGEPLDGLSQIDRARRLEAFASEFSGATPSLGLILSEYAIRDMTRNPNGWQQSLNEIKDHLSFQEKIQLVSHFGGRFSDNYNFDRAAGEGSRAEGVVTIEEMLTSVQHGDPGGVCRDVTNAQSQMLLQLGVDEDHIYQTAYSTRGAAHVVMAVRDPDDPNSIMRINYSYTDEVDDRAGGAALTQNSSLPDFGQNFRIYDAHGKPVGRVPTEFGEVLRDVTRDRRLSDGLSRNFSMNRTYIDTPIGEGSLYQAQTVSGDNIIGVAFRNNRTQQEGLNYGITLTRREGSRGQTDISQNAIYGYVNQEFRSPRYVASENLSFGLKATPYADLMIMQNSEARSGQEAREDVNFEATSGVILRADADFKSLSERTTINAGIEADIYLDVQNEQEGPSGGLRPAVDSITLDTTFGYEASENLDIIGEAAFVNRFSGTTFIGRGTLEYGDNTEFSMAYQRPLGDNIGFDSLSTENVELRASHTFYAPSRKVSASTYANYTEDLTFDNDTFGFGVGIKW